MLTNREFHLQTGNLAYKTGFSFTKRESWVTKGILGLLFTIISRVSSDFDMLLEDTDIDTIILGKNSDYSDSVIRLVKQMTKQYVDDFLGALRERGIDLKTGCIVFISGGAKLLREYLENTDKIGNIQDCVHEL